jgi:hypothetical protein
MASIAFDIVRRLVDRLTPTEQAFLLAYLASKLAGATGVQASAKAESGAATWDEFFAAGDALQEGPLDGNQSMTEAVISMRR